MNENDTLLNRVINSIEVEKQEFIAAEIQRIEAKSLTVETAGESSSSREYGTDYLFFGSAFLAAFVMCFVGLFLGVATFLAGLVITSAYATRRPVSVKTVKRSTVRTDPEDHYRLEALRKWQETGYFPASYTDPHGDFTWIDQMQKAQRDFNGRIGKLTTEYSVEYSSRGEATVCDRRPLTDTSDTATLARLTPADINALFKSATKDITFDDVDPR